MSSSTSRVRRKPPPSTTTTTNPNVVYPLQQVPSSSQQLLSNQPLQKLSFSERYPDPDPTDPFAPLWVLRNRTTSNANAWQKDPTQTHLLSNANSNNRDQQPETSSRQPDRRRSASTSYLHTITAPALKTTSPASDLGHSHGLSHSTIRAGRTSSVDNGNNSGNGNVGNNRFTLRRQSIRPIIGFGFGTGTTHTQVQVTPGTGPIIASASRSSIEHQLYPNSNPNPKHMHIRIVQPPSHPQLDNNDSSDSDSTRVHHGVGSGGYGLAHGRVSTFELERSGSTTTNVNAGRPHTVPLQAQAPTQANASNRQRTGSANKLARLFKPSRKNSQGQGQTDGEGTATIRTSMADIDRIRKSSISPPVFSTVVWSQGHGQDFVSIKNNPLHRTAIPLSAVASVGTGIDAGGVISPLLSDTDIQQDYVPIPIDTPHASTNPQRETETSLESSTPPQPKPKSTNTNTINHPSHSVSASQATSPPPSAYPTSPISNVPPRLSSRPSQTQTDETHSTFSFVHIPSPGCSPSMAYLSSFESAGARPQNLMATSSPTTSPTAGVTAVTHTVPDQVPNPVVVSPKNPPPQPSPTSATAASITSPIKNKMKRTTSRTPSSNPSVTLRNVQHPQQQSSEINHGGSITIDEWGLPSTMDLMKAAALPVISESGVRVTFGTLFARERVIVVFIRHFWCPLCHDYMTSVVNSVKKIPELMIPKTSTRTRTRTKTPGGNGNGNVEDQDQDEKSHFQNGNSNNNGDGVPIKLVVISNGSHTMIGKYKQIFEKGIVLEVYSDPSLAIYTALGMGKDPTSLQNYNHNQDQHHHQYGPASVYTNGRSRSRTKQTIQTYPITDTDEFGMKSDSCTERNCRDDNTITSIRGGGYVKHGIVSGIAMVFVRALKVGMPVWEKGGDLNQLGGEFVFGPGLICRYAHRMVNTRGHSPFEDVLRAAGIVISTSNHTTTTPLPSMLVKEKERDNEEKIRIREEQSMTSPTRQSRNTRGQGPLVVRQLQSLSPTRAPPSQFQFQSQSQFQSLSRMHHTTPEGKRSHRRRSVAHTSVNSVTSVGVIPVSAPMQVNAPVGPILVASPSSSLSGSTSPSKLHSQSPPVSPSRGKEKRSTTNTTSTVTAESRSSTIPGSNVMNIKANTVTHTGVGVFQKQRSIPKKSLDAMVMTKSDDEMWMEDRHMSLQRIKEKKNMRRGVDEVQDKGKDKEGDRNKDKERERGSIRRALERTLSQPNESTGTRRDLSFGMSMSTQREKSGNGMKLYSGSGRRDGDDDDIVLLGRETRLKVNLGRDRENNYNNTRKEQERVRERERERERGRHRVAMMNNVERAYFEDDVDTETVSDKTLVHR